MKSDPPAHPGWWGALLETEKAITYVRMATRYGYSYRYRLLGLALLSPLLTVPPLLTPLVMRLLIDKAYPARDFRLFGILCLALVGLGIFPIALRAVSGYLATYVQALLQCKLSLRLVDAVQGLPQSHREEHDAGMFLERITRDVRSVAESTVQLVPATLAIIFTFLAVIPLMLRVNWRIALLALAVVPVNYLITVSVSRRLIRLQQAVRALEDRITTFASETVEGGTIVRLFSLAGYRRKKLKQLLRGQLRLFFAIWRATTFWGELGRLASLVWGLVLLCGGWYLVFTDRLQLGQAVALGMYVNLLARPFQEVARLYQSLMTSSVAARRLLEVLNFHHPGTRNGNRMTLATPPQRIELRRVSFAYPHGQPCLHDLDLCLQSGQTVAIVGPSGAGKSTLVRILAGLDDRYHGQFLVNGCDLREINGDSYLRHVSLVPQTTFFFSDSIRENLGGGNGTMSTADLQRHARILGLDDIIDSTPGGYDTQLGSAGVRLSAGQYQKLAALRALLKNASVLLLDEVTSAVDVESERRLLQGIITLRRLGAVTLLVTHHIAITTEPWIDEIIVMVNGRIVERGSYGQLKARGGFYRRWLDINRRDTPD